MMKLARPRLGREPPKIISKAVGGTASELGFPPPLKTLSASATSEITGPQPPHHFHGCQKRRPRTSGFDGDGFDEIDFLR